MTRCPECGARVRDEAVTCHGCGADLGAPLTVLDLDDPELGLRPEDRFAAIPPGPRIVPRRVHDESNRAPIVLLAALVAFFVIGAVLGGSGSSSDESGGSAAPVPELDQPTGTTLLLLGPDGGARFHVDEETVRRAGDELEPLVDVVSGRGHLVASAVAGRVWAVTTDPSSTSQAQEIDAADGVATSAPVLVEGFVSGAVAAGLVVERHSGALEIVDGSGTTVLALPEGRLFLAAAGNQVATREADCTGGTCDVIVDNVDTGTTRTISVELAARGTDVASFSPDGQRLMVARSDGVHTRGVIVDVTLETVIPFQTRAVRRDSGAPLTWSEDGAWLFVAADRNGLDAVGPDGQVYRVGVELPPFEAIVTL